MYISPFSLFVSLYVYESLCDFVGIAFLLPFVLGFFLSVFCFVLFFVYFSVLVIIGGFVFWFGCSIFSFFKITFKFFYF